MQLFKKPSRVFKTSVGLPIKSQRNQKNHLNQRFCFGSFASAKAATLINEIIKTAKPY